MTELQNERYRAHVGELDFADAELCTMKGERACVEENLLLLMLSFV
jgi:hypothetical protein